MASADLFVGVDGGGTKTKVTVLDASHKVLAEELGGSTNPNSVGNEKAAANLKDVILRAVSVAQTKANQPQSIAEVRSIVLSLAGVDRAEDIKKVTGWVREFLPNEKTGVSIYNDAVAALASGTGGNLSGIVSISGTGTICYGRNASGQEARAFGFGALTDMGSGFQLGISALKAVWAAHDGSGPHTSILKGVQEHLGLKAIDELIPWTYSDLSWARIASLAPVVFQSAQQGDKVAQSILEETADYLSKGIIVVARKLGFAPAADATESKAQPVTIVLAGSINAQHEVAELVKKKVSATLPEAKLVHPSVDSAMGAALLAAKSVSEKVAGVV